MNMLNDKSGKLSSKRVVGIIILGIGIIFDLSIGITSIFRGIADPSTALSVGNALIYVGGGLLGIGVLENIGGKNNIND